MMYDRVIKNISNYRDICKNNFLTFLNDNVKSADIDQIMDLVEKWIDAATTLAEIEVMKRTDEKTNSI